MPDMATVEAYKKRVGKYKDGRPKYKTHYLVRFRTPERKQTTKRGFRRKEDARAYGEEVEHAKRAGEYVAPAAGRMTVGDLGPAWLERKRHRKPSTYQSLATAWRVHVEPRWGSVAVGEVAMTAVQAWVTELSTGREATGAAAEKVEPSKDGRRWLAQPKSATVVGRAYGVLAGILDDAVSDRRASANPARGVTLPRKSPKARTYLTHDQVQLLAEQGGKTSRQYEALVYVLAYCGVRWGEATALRVRHLDMLRRRMAVEENAVEVANVVHVGSPKTHERRSVPFPAFLADPLARLCEGKGRDDLVFHGVDGKHLRRPRPNRGWFVSALERAELTYITPHDLRHTAASLAVSAGANVKVVQRMLGHASAAMTLDTYADLFDDDLDAVAGELDAARSRAIGA